jgi:hypothetical protein
MPVACKNSTSWLQLSTRDACARQLILYGQPCIVQCYSERQVQSAKGHMPTVVVCPGKRPIINHHCAGRPHC